MVPGKEQTAKRVNKLPAKDFDGESIIIKYLKKKLLEDINSDEKLVLFLKLPKIYLKYLYKISSSNFFSKKNKKIYTTIINDEKKFKTAKKSC